MFDGYKKVNYSKRFICSRLTFLMVLPQRYCGAAKVKRPCGTRRARWLFSILMAAFPLVCSSGTPLASPVFVKYAVGEGEGGGGGQPGGNTSKCYRRDFEQDCDKSGWALLFASSSCAPRTSEDYLLPQWLAASHF